MAVINYYQDKLYFCTLTGSPSITFASVKSKYRSKRPTIKRALRKYGRECDDRASSGFRCQLLFQYIRISVKREDLILFWQKQILPTNNNFITTSINNSSSQQLPTNWIRKLSDNTSVLFSQCLRTNNEPIEPMFKKKL